MELNFNNGNTFFNLDSPDFLGAIANYKNVNRMIQKDVISFSITEKVGKLISGTLSLHDNTGIYSHVFRNGLKFNISWGYKKWNFGIIPTNASDPLRTGVRQGIKCLIQTPSGQGSEQGESVYNVTFIGLEFLQKAKNRVFESGTIGDVIAQCFQELGATNFIIDFPDKTIGLKKSNSIRQRESNYLFLSNLAREHNAHFHLSYRPSGEKIGIFIDSRKMDSPYVKGFLFSVTGAGDEKTLYYNSGSVSNVKSFSWQQHIGENGQGDGVTITYVEGKPVFSRFVCEGGSVTLWKLDQEKVRTYIHSKGNIQDEAQATFQIMNAKNFDSEVENGVKIRDFFYKEDVPFAPQGQGFTVNCAMHGDPMLTGLLKIKFKSGFPAPLQQGNDPTMKKLLQFYVRRATHNFNKQEYTCDVEICDTYTLTGSFVAPETMAEALSAGM